MFTYFAYNLSIHSDLAFPELAYSKVEAVMNQEPDVVISLREINTAEVEAADGGNRFVSILDNPPVAKLLVEFGRKIVVEPTPGIKEDKLRPLILGPLFAILLRQRGLLVLHASGVVINGGVVAFLGHSGWGKSTLANAFYNQGYSLLTDDVMAIQAEGIEPITFPAYPHVRLFPDSAASLGYDFEKLALIHAEAPKRNNSLLQGFPQAPLPLKRIYVLENIGHSRHDIGLLQPQEAFVELTRYSRVTSLLDIKEFVSYHLHQCAELIKKVPVCRLKRKHSLAAVLEIVKLVEEDLAQSSNIQPQILKA